MKNNWKWALGLVLTATVAYTAAERADKYGGAYPVWFNKGLYVGPNAPDPTANTANKVTRLLASPRVDYDFPSIGPGGAGQAGGHVASSAITLLGARLGDQCTVASTGGDGGINADLRLTCYVSAADTIIIRADAELDDAGSINPSDAGHYIYIRSSQAN